MKFQEWKHLNWNANKLIIIDKLKLLFNIQSVNQIIFDDMDEFTKELNNLTLLYDEVYANSFIFNEVYQYCVNNYLLYEKIKDLSVNGGLSEKEDENIKNSYSIGGFDNDNQDLASGALRNDHSSTSKNKTNNLEIIKKLQDILLIQRNKLINKIKEILVAIW